MYEFTHGGLWFRWKALDASSRRLLVASLATGQIGALPLFRWAGEVGYEIGYRAGCGCDTVLSSGPPALTPVEAIWLIGFSLVSGLLWWRFSMRQDEMFNRIQNWTLATSSIFTTLCLVLWALLDSAGLLPPPMPLATVGLCLASITVFWIIAVRRWA